MVPVGVSCKKEQMMVESGARKKKKVPGGRENVSTRRGIDWAIWKRNRIGQTVE